MNKKPKRAKKEKTISVKICLTLSEDSEDNDIDNDIDYAGKDTEGAGYVGGVDDEWRICYFLYLGLFVFLFGCVNPVLWDL